MTYWSHLADARAARSSRRQVAETTSNVAARGSSNRKECPRGTKSPGHSFCAQLLSDSYVFVSRGVAFFSYNRSLRRSWNRRSRNLPAASSCHTGSTWARRFETYGSAVVPGSEQSRLRLLARADHSPRPTEWLVPLLRGAWAVSARSSTAHPILHARSDLSNREPTDGKCSPRGKSQCAGRRHRSSQMARTSY